MLVKASNHDQFTTCARLAPTVGPEIAAIMRRDIEALPGKAALEACLYSEPLQKGLEITFTWGEGCPEVFRFPTQTKIRGAGPEGADTGSSRR